MRYDFSGRNVAIVVAHPAHELRVHHVLEITQPDVFVLTDGSGRCGASRIASTTSILRQCQARPAAVYGQMRDMELYQSLLDHDVDRYLRILDTLVGELQRLKIDVVIGDTAGEGLLAHDICRSLINAAVRQISAQRSLLNLEFPLEWKPWECPTHRSEEAIQIELDDAALSRKLTAAERYTEVSQEVQSAIKHFGEQAFRYEYLFPAATDGTLDSYGGEMPKYEQHGEQLVTSGMYPEVVRYAEHVQPLLAALESHRVTPATVSP